MASYPLQELFSIPRKPIPWKTGGLLSTVEESSLLGVPKYSVGNSSDSGKQDRNLKAQTEEKSQEHSREKGSLKPYLLVAYK